MLDSGILARARVNTKGRLKEYLIVVLQARSQGGCYGAKAPPEVFGSNMGEKEEDEKEEENSFFQHPPNQNSGYAPVVGVIDM